MDWVWTVLPVMFVSAGTSAAVAYCTAYPERVKAALHTIITGHDDFEGQEGAVWCSECGKTLVTPSTRR